MTDALFDLNQRVIAITGGLGQLGRQFARALCERGARIAILDHAEGAALPSEIAPFGAQAMILQADVRKRASLEQALSIIEAHWEVPWGLINNAALDSPPDAPLSENGPFETYPETSWDAVMEVNVKGVMQCCQVFGGRMAKLGRGSIVNVASIYGMVSPNQDIYAYRRESGEDFYKPVAYSASKSALYNLTRYLATYWGEAGVRVNTVSFAGVWNNQDPRFMAEYAKRMPIRRMAQPGEYNGTIVYLMSDASSYMTGSNMVVDGGWTAW